MNIIGRILLGAVTGWLMGIAVGEEGYGKVAKVSHVRILDTIYGIVGALFGEYLLFWIVVGKGNEFSSFATTVLGAIILVGAARLMAAKIRPYRTH